MTTLTKEFLDNLTLKFQTLLKRKSYSVGKFLKKSRKKDVQYYKENKERWFPTKNEYYYCFYVNPKKDNIKSNVEIQKVLYKRKKELLKPIFKNLDECVFHVRMSYGFALDRITISYSFDLNEKEIQLLKNMNYL